MKPQEETSAVIRDHLLGKIDEWRERLPPDGTFMGTLGAGIALSAVSLVGVLLRRAVVVLLPEVTLPERPTLGFYVGTIERYGRDHVMSCVQPSRRLVTTPEIKVLIALSRKRAALAHQEEAWASDAPAIGRLQPSEVRELLDVVSAAARLPIFDELICRDAQSSSPEA